MSTNKIPLKSVIAKNGIPKGGNAGQVLVKSSTNDYQTEWQDNTASSSSLTLPQLASARVQISYLNLKIDNGLRCPKISWNMYDTTYQAVMQSIYHQGVEQDDGSYFPESDFISGIIYLQGSSGKTLGETLKDSSVYGDGTTVYTSVYFTIYNQSESTGTNVMLYLEDGTKVTTLNQLENFTGAKIELFGTYLGKVKGIITEFPIASAK